MSASFDDVRGRRLEATDGEIGRVDDLLFDEAAWLVRYVVADTGTWLPGRQLLLAPQAVTEIGRHVRVSLTRDQVEASPPLSAHEPVTRRWEADMHDFYGYAPYWTQSPVGLPGLGGLEPPGPPDEPGAQAPPADLRLASADELTGYEVRATDDRVGHVDDLLLDASSWAIPAIVVGTHHVLPGGRVLVPVEEVESISWADRTLRLRIDRADVEALPPHRG